MKTEGVWFKGAFIPVGGGCYVHDSEAFYRGASPNLSRTIKAVKYDAAVCVEDITNQDMKKYRIRKLTPTECFRLMGVDDADIKKIKDAGISDSQQYKLAGNSIVVDVLVGIFSQMFKHEKDTLF